MEFIDPNKNGFLKNYVWDTQALNQLTLDDNMKNLCSIAYCHGHRYFITIVQARELNGVPDRTMKYSNADAWKSPQAETFEIMEALKFSRLSCVSLLYPNFWLLDGSMRILEDNGSRTDMFYAIYNNNNHHKRDATIAEATIYHECILISNDKRLRNKMNKFFPGSAITYDEYRDYLIAQQFQEVPNHAD